LFYLDDKPTTELEQIDPGDSLPGDMVALYDRSHRRLQRVG